MLSDRRSPYLIFPVVIYGSGDLFDSVKVGVSFPVVAIFLFLARHFLVVMVVSVLADMAVFGMLRRIP